MSDGRAGPTDPPPLAGHTRVALRGLHAVAGRGAQRARGDHGLLQAAPAFADGAPNLILPLVTAIAFACAASDVPRQVATLDPGRGPLLSLIPQQVDLV